MKKTIAILLILVIGMVGVFAAVGTATDTLKLETVVPAKYGLVISADKAQAVTADPENNILGKTLAESFVELQSKQSVTFADTGNNPFNSGTLYVNYMTNQRILATVTTTMQPLSPVVPENGTNEVTSKIGYTVTVVGGAKGNQTDTTHTVSAVDHSTSGLTVSFIEEAEITDGLRIKSRAFSIALNEADWDTASATDYSTTWTVELSINS